MGINYFTDEQLEQLRNNPYVKKVSEKGITYEEGFKEIFICDYRNGMTPTQIFRKYGFDTEALGRSRILSFSKRIRKQSERIEGFSDLRKGNAGRPKTKDLTLEEENERLKLRLKALKQENDFLKRVRYINRKQISKVHRIREQEKNTSSSKEL